MNRMQLIDALVKLSNSEPGKKVALRDLLSAMSDGDLAWYADYVTDGQLALKGAN